MDVQVQNREKVITLYTHEPAHPANHPPAQQEVQFLMDDVVECPPPVLA